LAGAESLTGDAGRTSAVCDVPDSGNENGAVRPFYITTTCYRMDCGIFEMALK